MESVSSFLKRNNYKLFEEDETSEILPKDLEEKVADFVKNHPNLDDEQMHDFAVEIGVNKHEVEEVAYNLLNKKLNQLEETDESKCKKNTDESYGLTEQEFVDILTGNYRLVEMSSGELIVNTATKNKGLTTLLLASLMVAGAVSLYFKVMKKTREIKLLELKIDKEEDGLRKDRLIRELEAKKAELKKLNDEIAAKKAEGKQKFDELPPEKKEIFKGKAEKMQDRLTS